MPRTSAARNTFLVALGTLTLPAQVDAAQPAGLLDGNAASLSLDTAGNLRTTLTGTALPSGTGVPVVNLGGIADTLTAVGTVTAPGAGVAIATLAIATGGVYEVVVLAGYGATGDAPNNMQLKNNGVAVGNGLYVDPGASSSPTSTRFARVTISPGINLTVNAIAAGGVGAVYIASITATRLS